MGRWMKTSIEFTGRRSARRLARRADVGAQQRAVRVARRHEERRRRGPPGRASRRRRRARGPARPRPCRRGGRRSHDARARRGSRGRAEHDLAVGALEHRLLGHHEHALAAARRRGRRARRGPGAAARRCSRRRASTRSVRVFGSIVGEISVDAAAEDLAGVGLDRERHGLALARRAPSRARPRGTRPRSDRARRARRAAGRPARTRRGSPGGVADEAREGRAHARVARARAPPRRAAACGRVPARARRARAAVSTWSMRASAAIVALVQRLPCAGTSRSRPRRARRGLGEARARRSATSSSRFCGSISSTTWPASTGWPSSTAIVRHLSRHLGGDRRLVLRVELAGRRRCAPRGRRRVTARRHDGLRRRLGRRSSPAARQWPARRRERSRQPMPGTS